MRGYRGTNNGHGFTLTELVAVIVILGALAAIALPRFVDLRSEAHAQAAETAASSFEQAMTNGRMSWAAEGQGTGVTLAGTPVAVTAQGWPRPAPASDQGCADLWNAALAATEGAVPGARTAGGPGWAALGFEFGGEPICYYQMQADTDPVHTVIYFPTNFFGFYEAGTVLQV